jgi:hypothetical protein
MTFIGWVDFANFMICVNRSDEGYICQKYVGGSKVFGTDRPFESIKDVGMFLLSLPNPPTDYITKFVDKNS